MVTSVSEESQSCIGALKTIVSILANSNSQKTLTHHGRFNDELERFSLWAGNIGALHRPESPMSVESRLHEVRDVLTHVLELLQDLNEVVREGVPAFRIYALLAS